jgi:hypothetical protein
MPAFRSCYLASEQPVVLTDGVARALHRVEEYAKETGGVPELASSARDVVEGRSFLSSYSTLGFSLVWLPAFLYVLPRIIQ